MKVGLLWEERKLGSLYFHLQTFRMEDSAPPPPAILSFLAHGGRLEEP